MAPNAEEELLVVKPWGLQPEKVGIRSGKCADTERDRRGAIGEPRKPPSNELNRVKSDASETSVALVPARAGYFRLAYIPVFRQYEAYAGR